ncbi:type II toxin-antitoxin system RelB/DinJ family antitoxin [Shewanella xiamenensis]|uniref:type II toxin-antitoxin system RelB/DinJ family antitoxin n=1 Tax=Shewanella xiamenensis TaxID=332186 RepID=UPI002E7C4FB3|nr:type II toxin-antitoxin system RelB/DinJ family antitoxin [Shewanella xiamenensis]MEE1982846.1 type II toxin-antitoxin system RelB/DinJ family antitoxin [Shewanella xiamenensis]
MRSHNVLRCAIPLRGTPTADLKKLSTVSGSFYVEVSMGTINIRIDDELKERSFAALEKLGVSPSEALRQTLEYVATRGALPHNAIVTKQIWYLLPILCGQ